MSDSGWNTSLSLQSTSSYCGHLTGQKCLIFQLLKYVLKSWLSFLKAYPIIPLLPCITLSRTCHTKHTMPSALTNEGCAFSEVSNISIYLYYHSQNEIQKRIEEAHINLFTCCLCKGINVDSAAFLAFEEDQTCKRLYAITCDDPTLADSHW